MKNWVMATAMGISSLSFAQVGVGTPTPSGSAQLDVVATNKGILIPRLALTNTTDVSTVTNGNVVSLLVYNTSTVADVTPGYYYWDGTRWVRLATGTETVTTLVDNGNGTVTYTDENGVSNTINLATGPQGPQGPAGPVGATGATGATGPIGATGPQGPAGTNGIDGVNGATGAAGPQGPSGPTGATGIAGPQGPMGLTGATGPAGVNGIDGTNGATGAVGPQGPAGPTGATGPIGATGPQGPAGANGIDGVNGIDGATGPQGPMGATGPQGPAGTNGIDGVNGADGATGPAGPQGIQGDPGQGTVCGSATTNFVTKFTGSTSMCNSQIYDDGTFVGIGTSSPSANDFCRVNGRLHVNDHGATPDSYGSISVTNPADANSYSYYSLTRQSSWVWGIGMDASSNMIFGKQNTATASTGLISGPKVTITAHSNPLLDGMVGVGTSSPYGLLANTAVNYGAMGEGCWPIYTFNWRNAVSSGWAATISTASRYGLTIATDGTSANHYPLVVSSGAFNLFGVSRPNDNLLVVRGDGRVGIGTTAPSERLDVMGNVRCTGTFITSDQRYKKDIHPLTGALEKLARIEGVTYHFRTEEFQNRGFDSGLQIGFIAQNVETVFPELVATSDDGYKAVDYSKMTPVLVEAVKELSQKNETLTKENEALKEQLEQLIKRVEAIENKN